jgi:hypothetical protein
VALIAAAAGAGGGVCNPAGPGNKAGPVDARVPVGVQGRMEAGINGGGRRTTDPVAHLTWNNRTRITLTDK